MDNPFHGPSVEQPSSPEEKKNPFSGPSTSNPFHGPSMVMESRLDEGDSSFLSNLGGGFVSGTQKTMEGDAANILNSYIDLGRFHSVSQDGEYHLWQSTPSWMGISQQEWDNMSPSERRIATTAEVDRRVREDWSPEESSIAYNLGRFVGMVATPSSAIPLLGESLPAVAASGAALGATGGALYSASEKGSVEGSDVALGAGLGAVLPVAAKAAIKGVNSVVARKTARTTLDEINTRLSRARQQTKTPIDAYKAVRDSMGLTDEEIGQIVQRAKSPLADITTKERASGYLHDRELARLSKEKKLSNRAWQEVKEPFKKAIEPIGNRINAISPSVKQLLNIMHVKNMRQTHEYTEKVFPFLKDMEQFNRWHPIEAAKFKKLALDGKGKEVKEYLNKYLGGESNYNAYRAAMDELYNMYTASGRKLKKLDFYFPRYIKDIKGLRSTLSVEDISAIEKEIRKISAKKGGITDSEVNDIYNKYLRGHMSPKGTKTTPGATKIRRLKELKDNQVQYYEDIPQSIHRYIDNAIKDINARNFFKHDKMLGGTASVEDSYIEKNIGALVNKLVQSGQMDERHLQELSDLLQIEFVTSKQLPSHLVRKFKDLSYASYLGNPFSAVTQLGDIPIGGFVNGVRNTFGGAKLAMTGKGLSPKEMGLIDNMIHEFADGGFTNKWLKRSLKWGGFTNIDVSSKGINLNGSVMKYFNAATKDDRALAATLKDWRQVYGREHLASIMNEFKNLDFNKPVWDQLGWDARTMVVSDLMKTQPLTTLDMPEMYHRMPNGRIMYMFRTFTLKYVNLLYRSLVDDWRQGNVYAGAAKAATLASIFTATGTTTDYIKGTLKGKDVNLGQTVWDNALKNLGVLDRYSVNKFGDSAHPITEFVAKFAPPVGLYDTAYLTARSAVKGDWENIDAKAAWSRVPVIGQLYALLDPPIGLGGYTENQMKALETPKVGE